MLSARKTWRQHLGDKLERVCPGRIQPDDHQRREGKLSQSEFGRMVQEAEKYRDEDEVNESKYEAENGLENYRFATRNTLTEGNSWRSSNAVTDADENMVRILVTDDS